MSKILTASDVESAPGKRLVLAKGERLTPLARDRAKELGVELVYSDAAPGTIPSAAPAAAPLPPPVLVPAAAPQYVLPAVARSSTAAGGSQPGLPPSGALYRRNALAPSGAAHRRGGRAKVGVVGAGHVGDIARRHGVR